MFLGIYLSAGILASSLYSIIKENYVYRATRLARKIIELCRDSINEHCLEFLRNIFVLWEPLKILLRFIRNRSKFDSKEIVQTLGEEMRYWNEKLATLGLPIKRSKSGTAPAKPFNEFVTRKFFKPLINNLDLLNQDIKKKQYITAKSRRDEPIIAAGIAHIVYSSEEPVLLSPFLDNYGVNFVLNAAKLSGNHKHIVLIVRRLSTRISINEIKKRAEDSSVELDMYISKKPLHAKVYASDRDLLITSANLLKTSLLRNIEFGIMIQGGITYEIESIISEFV